MTDDTTKKTILIVDDVSTNTILLSKMLAEHYNIITSNNGSDALQIINADAIAKPNLILLDVVMPEMDGYQVCRSIKDNPDSAHIPVIFISALSSLEEQILGFEAGADDYISKPAKADDLIAKIYNAFENQKQLQSKTDELNFARTTAMTAMTTISEMGLVNNYFKELASKKNFESLAQHLLTFIKSFSLNAIIRIDSGDSKPIFQSSNGVVLPIEKKLISNFRNKGAVFNFNSGTVFNYQYITLFVIDMPTDNEDFYGRIKDHLATVVEGSTSVIESLMSKNLLS